MQQDSNSTFKPALMLMTGRALAFTVTFFVPMLMVRVFAPAEFGTYKQFFLITYTLYVAGQLGLAECLYYFLPANPAAAGRYVFNSIIMLCGVGLAFSALLAVNAARISVWLNNPALAGYIPLAGPFVLFMLIGTVLEITMIIRKRYRLVTVTYAVSDVVRALMLMLPAVLTHSLWWVFIGGVASCLIRALAACVYVKTEFRSRIAFDRTLVRSQLGYAAPFALYVLVDLAYWNYHQYAVSYFFDAAAFAIYSVGCLQIPFVEFIATPAANVMMVRMGEEAREGRTNHLQWIWSDTTRRLALMFFPIVGLLVVNARPLITLMFTANYAASIPIFMVWSLSILAAAFPTDSVLRVFAETRFLLFINIVRLTLTAATIYWFISRFHLIGPVIVTLIGLFVSKALALIRLTALMKIGLVRIVPWKSLGGILAVATLAALPAALVTSQLTLRPVYVLPLSGIVYLSVYSVLIWGFDLVTTSERLAIATWLSRPARVLISRS